MQKWAYVATKAHAGAFRHQREAQTQFADSGSLLETWVNMLFVHDLTHFCVEYTICFQQLICQIMVKSLS